MRPTLGGTAPAIIVDCHVDAAVDEELHGLVILVPHQLMQDAGGFMGDPVSADIGPVPEKSRRSRNGGRGPPQASAVMRRIPARGAHVCGAERALSESGAEEDDETTEGTISRIMQAKKLPLPELKRFSPSWGLLSEKNPLVLRSIIGGNEGYSCANP